MKIRPSRTESFSHHYRHLFVALLVFSTVALRAQTTTTTATTDHSARTDTATAGSTASIAKVQAVDKTNKTLTLRTDNGQSVVLQVTDGTTVKYGKFSDISVGSKIGIRYKNNQALEVYANGEMPPPDPVIWEKRPPKSTTDKP